MAIAFPFLLLVVAGVVDLGMLYWEKQVITNASREGARAAAKAGISGAAAQTVAQVRQMVQDYVDNFNLKDAAGAPLVLTTGTNFFYQWDLSSNPPKLWVELKDIPVRLVLLPAIMPFYGGGLGSVVNLNAKTTMAAEWSNPPS
ncbi:MAG: pilus assembly protein [Deltaproteobacteria bacterium]|nr:pilus assembly protein [Deltaproteobacteria bacterium]